SALPRRARAACCCHRARRAADRFRPRRSAACGSQRSRELGRSRRDGFSGRLARRSERSPPRSCCAPHPNPGGQMKSSLSQRQLQRRRILQGSSLLMLSPLVKAQSGETLRVGTFGGTFIEAIKATIEPKFKAMTGASVEYVAGGPRDHISKMAAAGGRNVPFDVVDLPADSQADCIKQGLFETVQPSELSNAGKLQPEAWINKGYAPAREWIVSGILYIEERIKAAGLSPNAGFDLLKDPKMAGH